MNSTLKKRKKRRERRKKVFSFGTDFLIAREISVAEIIHTVPSILM